MATIVLSDYVFTDTLAAAPAEVAAGELAFLSDVLYVHETNNLAADNHVALDHVHAGDQITLEHPGGSVTFPVATVSHVSGVYTIGSTPGHVSSTGTWPPSASTAVTLTHTESTPVITPPGGTRMATTIFKIDKGQVGFSLTDPGNPVADAVIADYDAYSCLVTAATVTNSANFDTSEVPGTMCDPASETVTPSAATFTLELSVLQDPQDDATTGLAKFLWDNDSGVTGQPVWFYVALAEDAAPKIIGQCYLSPMDFGGEPRTVLTADLSFPIEGRPTPEFGTTADV